MTKNEWLEREAAEEEALRGVLESLILFCWDCYLKDKTPPTNQAIEAVVGEAVQTYKDFVEDL